MTSMPSSPRILVVSGLLLALLFTLNPAQAEPVRTPRQMIDDLGIQTRQILESATADKTPEDAERAVAEQITALSQGEPGHLSLTEADPRGRTPLMLAASGAYPLVVAALLADPGVKLRINAPDADGATAWMVASFAPALTLAACQPGNLTAERAPLLPPYLRRMNHLLKAKGTAIGAIVRLLEEAGAEVRPDEAKRIWLARCPNATAALRAALAGGDLMPTLVKEAITRQSQFNKAARDSLDKVPARPPEGMQFVAEPAAMSEGARMSPLLTVHQMDCGRMNFHPAFDVQWKGEILFDTVIETRAGVVEAVDFKLLAPLRQRPGIDTISALRSAILGALAHYECKGDQVFEQEFQFKFE